MMCGENPHFMNNNILQFKDKILFFVRVKRKATFHPQLAYFPLDAIFEALNVKNGVVVVEQQQ